MCTNHFNVLTVLLCLIFSQGLQAQKPQKLADTHFKNRNFLEALPIYEEMLETDSLNAENAISASICILETNMDRTLAIPILERLFSNNIVNGEAAYLLAKAYTFEYNFDKSTFLLEKHKSILPLELADDINRLLKNNETAKILMQNPVNVEFQNLGSKVNSEYPDYYPYITEDESSLVFTSRRKKSGTTVEFDGYYNSDIFMVQKFNTEYPKLKNTGTTINTNFDEQVVGLSRDGLEMMVYIDHVDDYGDIYLSNWKSTKYNPIQKLGINVNSEELETSASFSDDGNTLFFASRRPGGFGGLDLYMSRKLPNGTWGKSQNLGPKVNTAGDEDFPFLAQGDKLFFSSNGHPGMGGYDLNVTVWETESNIWGDVVNLGFPINTPEDNRTISFNKNGSHAYVSMYRKDGLGDLDIYRVVFHEKKFKPAMMEFAVLESGTETSVESDIVILDAEDNIYGIYRPQKSNGKYMIPLIPGSYNISIEADGYQEFYEQLIVIEAEVDGKTHHKKLFLNK